MMPKFTKEMSQAVRAIKPPYTGIAVDFVETQNYISIRMYENQIMALSDGQKVSVMEYLHKLRNTIMMFGVEKVFFEGVKGDPPGRGMR